MIISFNMYEIFFLHEYDLNILINTCFISHGKLILLSKFNMCDLNQKLSKISIQRKNVFIMSHPSTASFQISKSRLTRVN